jgi:hypothetical protein
MMLQLTAEHPEIEQVLTNIAGDNAAMRRVNEQVGYVTTSVMKDVEADATELNRKLSA